MNKPEENFSTRLKFLRGGKSLRAFAAQLGISHAGLAKYEKGSPPKLKELERISQATGRSVNWLLNGEGKGEESTSGSLLSTNIDREEGSLTKLAIVEDTIAAGPGSEIDFSKVRDWAQVTTWRLKPRSHYYLLRVTGDSMEPVLHRGSLILVNLSRQDPGRLKEKLVAAYLPHERGATVKILREDESGKCWLLHALNPEYKDRAILKKEEGFQVAAVEATFLE